MAAPRTNWIKKAKSLLGVFLESQTPSTERAYRVDLEAFRQWMHAATGEAETLPEALADLLRAGSGKANEIAKRYQANLRNKLAANTTNRRLACLRSYTRMARDIDLTNWRLRTSDLRTAICKDTTGPGREAILRMIKIARQQGGQQGPRDMALILLLYGMALRVGEVVAIDYEDIHISDQEAGKEYINIIGKGRNEAERITMPDATLAAVAGWATHRGDHPGPFFTNMSRAHDPTKRLSADGVRDTIKRIGRAAGVDTTPHGLRHTAISDAVRMPRGDDRRASLLEVQAFSRHRDLKTLQVYFDQEEGAAAEIANTITAGM